jgi:hypothetical protein
MIPPAFCVHRTSDRARIRIPSRKGDGPFFASLKDKLSSYSPVQGAEVNPQTGSLLLHYSGDLGEIASYAENQRLFRLSSLQPGRVALATSVVKAYRNVDNQVKAATRNELDLPRIAFLSLAGAGIYQIARGNLTAIPWYTAFWYALNVFLKAKDKEEPME